jgi:hypothetical protein
VNVTLADSLADSPPVDRRQYLHRGHSDVVGETAPDALADSPLEEQFPEADPVLR